MKPDPDADERQDSQVRVRRLVRVGLLAAAVYVVAGAVVVVAFGTVIVPGPEANASDEFGLLTVLAITMGSVIAGAFVTALIYSQLNYNGSTRPADEIFRESIKWFAIIASPIAAGYGIAQVISKVGEVLLALQQQVR